MFALRTLVLSCCLPALALGAPAPFAREKPLPDAHRWSKPANGLRARLVAAQTRYAPGDTVKLTLEIQNVSREAIRLEDQLSRLVSEPDVQVRGWSVTRERVRGNDSGCGKDVKRVRMQIEEQRRRSLTILAAGATHRIAIHVEIPLHDEKLAEVPEEADEDRVERLRFTDDLPTGFHDLRVTFRDGSESRQQREELRLVAREANARHHNTWKGAPLTSPPVRIEIVK